jgi:3-hydroxyacyl-[acyl-carrier-protein] dehydratase
MPLNDFYKYRIITAEQNAIAAEVVIDAKHAVYEGHFPEQPVTPGVILVEMIRYILSEHIGKQLMLTSAKELKFVLPVIPSIDSEINLNIDFELIENNYKVAAIFSSGEKTFTKLKGVFSAS